MRMCFLRGQTQSWNSASVVYACSGLARPATAFWAGKPGREYYQYYCRLVLLAIGTTSTTRASSVNEQY